jgi:hypothetical protein
MAINPKKRKPLGQPLIRTDEDLDKLAEVTPADIEAAKVFVQSVAPVVAKLLDAQVIDDTPQPPQ